MFGVIKDHQHLICGSNKANSKVSNEAENWLESDLFPISWLSIKQFNLVDLSPHLCNFGGR